MKINRFAICFLSVCIAELIYLITIYNITSRITLINIGVAIFAFIILSAIIYMMNLFIKK